MEIELSAFTLLGVGVAWATVGLWLVGAALTLGGLWRQKPLGAVGDARLTGDDAPFVSILVPARNEEGRVLEAAVRSMLRQDYGRFEVVAVNDRSTDATGSILHSIARVDERLRVIEGVEPPAGWLGKPHAMHQAFAASRGEWALATDADVIFEPHALRTALAHALDGRYDAVTLLPHVDCLSFWERVFMPVFGWFMLVAMPVERVNNPARRAALGVGGFFLMKADVLRRLGGYGAVRGEVAEDLRLAETLKRAGARLRLEYGMDLLRTRMQTNFREIWEGFTKNLFAGAKFSLWQATAGAASVVVFAVAPLPVAVVCAVLIMVAGVEGVWVQVLIPSLAVWVIQVGIFAVVNRASGIPIAYALSVPLGHALFVAILLNSAVRIATGSGVTWKGRKLYERAGVRPPRTNTLKTPDVPIADE